MKVREIEMSNCCDYCDDGDGSCVYPYYGVAPHLCYYTLGKPIGESEQVERSMWPANFEWDPESGEPDAREGKSPGAGVYTHCLKCGASG